MMDSITHTFGKDTLNITYENHTYIFNYYAYDTCLTYENSYKKEELVKFHKIFDIMPKLFRTMLKKEPEKKINNNEIKLSFSLKVEEENIPIEFTLKENKYDGDKDVGKLIHENKVLNKKVDILKEDINLIKQNYHKLQTHITYIANVIFMPLRSEHIPAFVEMGLDWSNEYIQREVFKKISSIYKYTSRGMYRHNNAYKLPDSVKVYYDNGFTGNPKNMIFRHLMNYAIYDEKKDEEKFEIDEEWVKMIYDECKIANANGSYVLMSLLDSTTRITSPTLEARLQIAKLLIKWDPTILNDEDEDDKRFYQIYEDTLEHWEREKKTLTFDDPLYKKASDMLERLKEFKDEIWVI